MVLVTRYSIGNAYNANEQETAIRQYYTLHLDNDSEIMDSIVLPKWLYNEGIYTGILYGILEKLKQAYNKELK